MRIFVWLFRAFLFFSLFAFSLNNQQTVSVNWFFGQAWTAPMVIVVLVAFAAGLVIGVMAMAPSWWRQRRLAQRGGTVTSAAAAPAAPAAPSSPPPGTPAALIDGI